jgi:hypothetical protein
MARDGQDPSSSRPLLFEYMNYVQQGGENEAMTPSSRAMARKPAATTLMPVHASLHRHLQLVRGASNNDIGSSLHELVKVHLVAGDPLPVASTYTQCLSR